MSRYPHLPAALLGKSQQKKSTVSCKKVNGDFLGRNTCCW